MEKLDFDGPSMATATAYVFMAVITGIPLLRQVKIFPKEMQTECPSQ
jgi:hypothetical protein